MDAGVETYTRKTFSAQRYEIWTMQSAYHSLLPTIDGVMQAPGRTFAAREASYQAGDDSVRFSLDIAGAYPAEAKIKSWQRTISLHRGQDVEIVDDYELANPAGEIALSLLTPCEVELGVSRQVNLSEASLPDGRRTGSALLTYDADKFTLAAKEIAIEDARLGGVWGQRLTCLAFTASHPPQKDAWTFQVRIGG